MTAAKILAITRRIIGDATVDDAVADLELFQYVSDAGDWFNSRGHVDFVDMLFDMDTVTITPEPTIVQGLLLAYRAAMVRMTDIYNAKLDSGDVGRSWRSGLEEESSISLVQGYRAAINTINRELEELIIIKRAPDTGVRWQ